VSKKEDNSGNGTLAVFTVCGDAELSNLASLAPSYFASVRYAGEFEDYITAERRPHFSPAIRQAALGVALIDFDGDPEQALETAETLRLNQSPPITSIAVGSNVDAELLLRAMRAGCSEFLEKPVAQKRFEETLQRIHDRVLASSVPAGRRGQVVSLLGVKGGVGTTTLAVHLAVLLAQKHGKKTLLIDSHHQLGHVCLYLGLKENNYHFDELLRNVERLDANLLKGFVIRHGSGLDVLSSPDVCAPKYASRREDIEQVLDSLREEYDYILFDVSMSDQEFAGAMVQFSDEVVLVSTPDLAALRGLARHIDHFGLAQMGESRLRIVMNRNSISEAITAPQIEKAVRIPIYLTVPNYPVELLRALNEGQPVAWKRRSEFNTQMDKWGSRLTLVGDQRETSAGKKRFAFWK
jgi:pilus assembly protein CpaE